MVDAVRAIPGRRFDWDAKEWWAPQADSTAPYVKGVIERYPSLLVAADVTAWLADATSGWVGRVSAARLSGRGAFVLETISGELPDELAASPRSAAAASGCRSRRRSPRRCWSCAARGSTSARCAARCGCRSGRRPRRRRWRSSTASARRASRSTSTGIPTRSPRSSRCPPARRTAARCRSTPISSSRSSTTCAPTASRSRRTRARSWSGCGPSTTRRSRTSAARAPTTRRRSRPRPCSAASCARSSAPASRTCCARGGRSWPTSRGSARPSRRSRRSRRTTRSRPS